MKGPKHYDRALVPEHLTKQTIELLPFDQAYYISPGERDDYEPPAIFVTPERKLVMSRSHDIDVDDAYPESPIGLVGVMHVTYVDPESQALRDAFIADLRFISDNALVDVDPGNCDAENQEEYMGYLDMLNDTVEFDAFIAPELFEEPKKGEVTIPGVFYGNPVLHPELKKLRKKADKRMRKYAERQEQSAARMAERAAAQKATTAAQPGTPEPSAADKQKQPAYLVQPFSHGK